MYSLNTPPLRVDPPDNLVMKRSGKARRWRGVVAALEVLVAAAAIIAAPLADREFVPATFVDQIDLLGAAIDDESSDPGQFTLPDTAGEPVISNAAANGEYPAPRRR